jgi:hypothetical protein
MRKLKHLKIELNIYFINLFFILCFLFPVFCFARPNEIVVTPTIIDRKAEARDILEFSVNLKNQGTKKATIYPIVNDISVEEGRQEFLDPGLLSKSSSLAGWVRISRGRIEIQPGKEIDIPLSVEVSPVAEPGKYYAVISFAQGSNQYDAKKQALEMNEPKVMLNIEIEEHVIEKAQINRFQTEKKLFFEFPVKFFLEVENIGNREINPEGSIYIYNRKGEEIALIPINQNIASVAPLAINSFENIWSPEKAFGQYKAKLVAEYGIGQGKSLQDTIYFWVLPKGFLLFTLTGILVLTLILLSTIFKRTKKKPFKNPSEISTIDISSSTLK